MGGRIAQARQAGLLRARYNRGKLVCTGLRSVCSGRGLPRLCAGAGFYLEGSGDMASKFSRNRKGIRTRHEPRH